jgi:hypothetical protein
MDEIDAALDFRNVSIVANYIAERTKNAQFVIISLRNNMFELADRLVGIYKTSHCTKSIAINPNMIASFLALPTHTSSASAKRSSAAITSSQRNNSTPAPEAAADTPIVDASHSTNSNADQNTNYVNQFPSDTAP